MKLAIVILAALGLVCGKPVQNGSLQDDLNDFLALVPKDKVLEIAMDYLYNDKEVQEFVAYMQSEEFPKIHKTVEYLEEYKDCIKYTNDHVIDVYAIVNEYHDSLGYPPFQPTNSTRTSVGIHGLIHDVVAALPLDDMKALYSQKKETSELYKALDQVIRSPEFTNFMNTVRTLPEWKVMRHILQEKRVDVDYYMERIKQFFGLSRRGTRSLHEDVYDFMTLVPKEKILEIALNYLHSDKEMQEFVVYMQSEEYPKIKKMVEYLKEYKYCLKFVGNHGVDVYEMVNEIHDILGYPPFQPTNSTRRGVGIKGLIDDVMAALPLDDMKALLHQKKETSELYKAMVSVIQTPQFMNLVNNMRTMPEWQVMHHSLQNKGVDVDYYMERIMEIFGLSRQATRRLQDKMNDFMAQFLSQKMLEIAMDYLHNDKEVQEFIANVQSEEFPRIHKIVEYLKEYKDCIKYNDDHVIDVYAIVKEFHDSLGYPPFQPTNSTRMGVGIHGLIDDVIAALPVDVMNALYYQKKETSESYKALDTVIRTPEFMNFMNTVRTLPEWKVMRHSLQEKSVDVEHYVERIKEFFGLSRQGNRSLHEDVYNFMTHFPTQKILGIFQYYLDNDKEVQRFVVYMQSDEFPEIQKIIQYLKEYKNCLKFVSNHGVDVSEMVNEIHDILGYPPFQPTNNTRRGVGIPGLIDDVIAALPLDMSAPYYQKKEKSELHKALDTAVRTPEFMNFVNTVRTLPEWKEMRNSLQERGVDVDHIYELLRALFL